MAIYYVNINNLIITESIYIPDIAAIVSSFFIIKKVFFWGFFTTKTTGTGRRVVAFQSDLFLSLFM